MNKTDIEWTEFTSNPIKWAVRGTGTPAAKAKGWHCEKVSAGCANCYAERLNLGRFGNGLPFTPAGGATLAPVLDEAELQAWLTRKKPATIFVEDMSDLFGHWVADEMLDRIFAVMALCPQHTFQVLTKRPERMRSYMDDLAIKYRVQKKAEEIYFGADGRTFAFRWPLPNVWLGVSVEDQASADARIPELLRTPAAVRFVSYEPALGPVDLLWALNGHACQECADWGDVDGEPCEHPAADYGWKQQVLDIAEAAARPTGTGLPLPGSALIHWLIVGGESGPGARPCNVDWIRSAVAQCQAAGVACFVKQLGSMPVSDHRTAARSDEWIGLKTLRDAKGGDPREWPEDLRVRAFPQVAARTV